MIKPDKKCYELVVMDGDNEMLKFSTHTHFMNVVVKTAVIFSIFSMSICSNKPNKHYFSFSNIHELIYFTGRRSLTVFLFWSSVFLSKYGAEFNCLCKENIPTDTQHLEKHMEAMKHASNQTNKQMCIKIKWMCVRTQNDWVGFDPWGTNNKRIT